jgi:hypothetical protein
MLQYGCDMKTDHSNENPFTRKIKEIKKNIFRIRRKKNERYYFRVCRTDELSHHISGF